MISKSGTADNIIAELVALTEEYPTLRPVTIPVAALASVDELESEAFMRFMSVVNRFSSEHGFHIYEDKWSKVWEYPWLWFKGLSSLGRGTRVLDIGSGSSPMPWLFALLGADVTMSEISEKYVAPWEQKRSECGVDIKWCIVNDECLPFPDSSFDVVTSFSVIEHQADKAAAIEECARVLCPGGIFALSFDICEEEWGMTYPERLGAALSIRDFRDNLWNHPSFCNGQSLSWRFDDCRDFLEWHWVNYVVGAAILSRRSDK